MKLSYYFSPQFYGFDDLFIEYLNPETEKNRVVAKNIPHCMPVWRKSLHEKYEYFEQRQGEGAADFEFWVRCASQRERFYNLNAPLGIYYCSSTTCSVKKTIRQEVQINRIVRMHSQGVAP